MIRIAVVRASLFAALISGALAAQAPDVRGTVRTVGGVAIPEAEVRIQGTDFSAKTSPTGEFSFSGAPRGLASITFRRVGFLPAIAMVNIPSSSDSLEVTMVASAASLDTVKVIARLNVLAGVVIDSTSTPVPGANITVIGTDRTATTDSAGRFLLTSVRAGPVVYRVQKQGFAALTGSARLDEWRGVVLRLTAFPKPHRHPRGENADAVDETTWRQTAIRLSQRSARSAIVTREELEPFGKLSLTSALPLTVGARPAIADLRQANFEACLIMNGSRPIGLATLGTIWSDEVEFLEIYPSGSDWSKTLGRMTGGMGCRPQTTVSAAPPSRNRLPAVREPTRPSPRDPLFVVVWLTP